MRPKSAKGFVKTKFKFIKFMQISATSAPGAPCHHNEFQCATRQQCVPAAYHCDGEPDCLDQSDEKGCGQLLNLLIMLI